MIKMYIQMFAIYVPSKTFQIWINFFILLNIKRYCKKYWCEGNVIIIGIIFFFYKIFASSV